VSPDQLDSRISRLEAQLARPKEVGQHLAAARRRLLDEVDRVGQAHGIVSAADPKVVLRELDGALAAVCAARHLARRPRP
jgi:hypothetical protein